MKMIGNELKAGVHIDSPDGKVLGTYISFFVPLKDEKARNTLKKYVSEYAGKDFLIEIKGATRYQENR